MGIKPILLAPVLTTWLGLACDGGTAPSQSNFQDFSINTFSASVEQSGDQWLWRVSLTSASDACGAAANPSLGSGPNSQEILFQFRQEDSNSANTITGAFVEFDCPRYDLTSPFELIDGCAYYRAWDSNGELEVIELARFGGITGEGSAGGDGGDFASEIDLTYEYWFLFGESDEDLEFKDGSRHTTNSAPWCE